MEEILSKPKRHVFVCVNDRTQIPGNIKPSCGPRINHEMVKEVKEWSRENVPGTQITKVLCLGYCNPDGGVMCVYPEGRFVKGLKNAEDIKEIIKQSF